MTKATFYDHFLDLGGLEKHLRQDEELILIAKKTLRNHALVSILQVLPKDKHDEFLSRFVQEPSDAKHWEYLRNHVTADLEKIIKSEITRAKKEILRELK
jgi:hypothetical protein